MATLKDGRAGGVNQVGVDGYNRMLVGLYDASGNAIGAANALPVAIATGLAAGTNTIGAVTQAGTWTVGLSGALPAGSNAIGAVTQGAAGANAWKVDGSAVTQPISAAALPLPAGAATAAKQPAPGAAGSPSADVLTVQGAAAGTPLKVDASATTQPVSAAALPLPANAATSAKQDSIITQLGTIASNTGASSVDFTATGSIAAANAAVSITGQGVYSVTASIVGTFSATLVAEGQLADSTWVQIPMYQVLPSLPYAPTFSVSSAQTVLIVGGGYLQIRIRASAYTSGTASVAMDASLSQQATFAAQLGPWQTAPVDGSKATYSAAIAGLVAAGTTPTDIFSITGSASKIVRVTRLAVSAIQGTAAVRDVILLKRSTANSGGTFSLLSAVPHDSASAPATAPVAAYTANPTLGTLVGNIRAHKMYIGVAAGAGACDDIIWDFGVRPSQAVVLRNASQVLALNLNGVASASSSFDVNIEWTEESP